MRARRYASTWLLLAVLGLSCPAFAQVISDPNHQLNPGGTIFVTEESGRQIQGKLLRLSPDMLVVLVNGKERQIPATEIGRIERPDDLWNGIFWGAVPGLLMAGAFGACSHNCGGAAVLVLTTAGIGALIDAGSGGYSIVYGPELPSPSHAAADPPLTTLKDLWVRVRQGDVIEVQMRGGRAFRGRFAHVSADLLSLTLADGIHEVASSDVASVVRIGNHHDAGALIGGLGMAFLFMVGSSDTQGSDSAKGALIGAYIGSLWGMAIGAGISRHVVVYGAEDDGPQMRVTPFLAPGRTGVTFSIQF
jgi:hypothetical protein